MYVYVSVCVCSWICALSRIMRDRKSFTITGGCCKLAFIAFIPHSFRILLWRFSFCALRFAFQKSSLRSQNVDVVAGNGNVLGRRNYHGSQTQRRTVNGRAPNVGLAEQPRKCCYWAEDVIRVKAKWQNGKWENN